MTDKQKELIRKALLGRRPTEETLIKLRIIHKNNKATLGKHWFLSDKTKERMKIAQQKRVQTGNHNWWVHGIADENLKIRGSTEYTYWRKAVFERDDYTCQECGIRSSVGIKVVLNADHIKPFALFPELRFDIDNGRTLCEDCHRQTETFGINFRRYAIKLS